MQYTNKTSIIAADIPTLLRGLSLARLTRYAQLAPQDIIRQFELYQWNTALSEALYTPIQGLEILCRNYFHESIAKQYGESWFDNDQITFALAQRNCIIKAKENLKKENKTTSPDNLISLLSFGFWTGLLGPYYETKLWRPCFHKIFVANQRPFLRKQAYYEINLIRLLRNRIAHHEPILRIDLPKHYQRIIKVITWFCPATAAWVQQQSRFTTTWQLPANPFINYYIQSQLSFRF